MLASWLIHSGSWKIQDDGLRHWVAFAAGILLFVSIGHGALLVYPMAFFRGATVGERIVACLITPFLWNIKEIIRVSEFFTWGESLYYGLNSAFLPAVLGGLGQMGLCELLCRWRLRRQGRWPARVVTATPLLAILLGLGALFVFLVWGQGVHWFYIYMEGYKALFL